VGSVRNFFHPHPVPELYTLPVLLVVVVVKELLFRRVLREGEEIESSAVRSDAWHHRSDALTSVAAGIGIAVAWVGGGEWAVADDVAAFLAAGVIAWNGWRLLRPALDELMDTEVSSEWVQGLVQVAQDVGPVVDVEKCRVRKSGYRYLVEMHLEVDPEMTVERAHAVAHEVKDRVRDRFPEVLDVLLHVEPARAGLPRPASGTQETGAGSS
jgi:cation diffusion facilitator family transporter